MAARRATCSCGQLKVETLQDPHRISVCHCLACQLRTGSVFGAQARFARSDTRIEGRSSPYVRQGDSGQKITFNFCPDCGATVYWQLEAAPEVIAVPIGAFADPNFPAPKVSVYESRRHGWVQIAGQLERCD